MLEQLRANTASIMTFGFGIVSLVSFLLWFRDRAKHEKEIKELKDLLSMERQHFSWGEVIEACHALTTELRQFAPDIIVTTPGTPMTVASLVVEALHRFIPMHIVYVSVNGVEPFPAHCEPSTHTTINSADVTWFVPLQLLEQTDKRIAIIDDVTLTSVYFDRLLELLQKDKTIKRDDILTASLIASTAISQATSLNWKHFSVVNNAIYMPWGMDKGNTPTNHLGRL